MTGKNIISINGRSYDSITGMPASPNPHPKQPAHEHQAPAKPHRAFTDINAPAPVVAPAKQPHPTATENHPDVTAHNIHRKLQKSQTLHRAALKKPSLQRPLTPSPVVVEADRASVGHPAISKFGSLHHKKPSPAAQPAAQPDRQPRMHPVVAKALANRQPAQTAQPQSTRELKEALIREQLEQQHSHTHHEKSHHRSRQPRLATILTSSLALLILAGYLTYINLPNISMRVAATRAGISANYPNYQPDGYHFAGPITYQPGQVNISFKSNTNSGSFTIQQKASNWDSQAVLDNYVSKQTGTYLTYQERGLTIYSFGNHAAWVNGGLLYTIDGDAPLNSDQLLHIATSM